MPTEQPRGIQPARPKIRAGSAHGLGSGGLTYPARSVEIKGVGRFAGRRLPGMGNKMLPKADS